MKLIDISTRKFPNTFTMVDDEDFDWLNQWKWSASCVNGILYANRGAGNKKTIYIHRLISKSNAIIFCDHKDGNGLNNQRSNLRLATHQQNMVNRKKQKGAFSKFKGVSLDRKTGLFKSQLTSNRKYFYCGIFKNEIEAALAYDKKAKELNGEFARLNFPL